MSHACEIFVVRDEQGPILYAPLHDLVARINESAVAAVGRYLEGKTLSAEDDAVLETLSAYGFFEEACLPHSAQDNKPVQVTLFPTDGCNMRCTYCYAAAEETSTQLSCAAGCAAIDRVAANAITTQSQDFIVGFHGNGEPMTAFPLIRDLCTYAEEQGEKLGIIPKFTVATNGVFDRTKLDYLLKHFAGLHISFDGLPEIQNRQRPLANGAQSFPVVDRTLRAIDASTMYYGIRATLTANSLDRLEEIAAFVVENYPHCAHLHIEPAWECGRCVQTRERAPEIDEFLERFIAARDICEGSQIDLVYSAARAGTLCDAFCGACNDNFTVTSEGLVTACFEVSTQVDPRADTYIYGSFDEEEDHYIFDDEKRKALHRYTVYNMDHCTDCFCKFHCGGDCIAKVLQEEAPENHRGSERCAITRALTLDTLPRRLKAAEKMSESENQREDVA